jgi:hypothetical protein
VPAGKRILRINLDETAICLFQGDAKGNVFLSKTDPAAVQNIPLGQRRTYLTHVAFICDDPDVQVALPQVIIANEHTVKARDLAALRSACPPHVELLREKSAWVNAPILGRIVRWLAAWLAPFLGEYQPMLLFDAAKPHISGLFTACARARIWPLLVPAKVTWLLQPLDTHAFFRYKIYIMKAYQAARVRAIDGDVSIAELMACVSDGIRLILNEQHWAGAFDSDGFGPSQAGVSGRLLSAIQVGEPCEVPATRPTLPQLQCCFPKRSRAPHRLQRSLWRPFDAPPAAPVVGAAAAAGSAALGARPKTAPPGGGVGAVPVLRRSARVAAAKLCPRARSATRVPEPPAPAKAAAVAAASTPAPPPRAAAPKFGIMTRSRSRAHREA